jgi:hypothetical protein
VVGFGRRADGTLVPLDAYETGGVGRASMSTTPPRLNSLISEDSILAVDGRFLLVVNAGSNNVTSFRINGDFSLTRVDIEASGGTAPISLAYRDGVVYVANADQDGTFTGPPNQSGNITAMRLDQATGQLTPIAGFSVSLNARPADLEITPDGAYLVASALNAGAPQLPQPTGAEITSFRIQPDGTLAATPAGTGHVDPVEQRGRPQSSERHRHRDICDQRASVRDRRGGAHCIFDRCPGGEFRRSPDRLRVHLGNRRDGSLIPRTQDFLLGSSFTSGPTQAGSSHWPPDFGWRWSQVQRAER